MDIVVTIPKREYLNDDLETEHLIKHSSYQFWTMNKVPKKLNVGDRVYFVKNGKVESSMEVFDIKHNHNEICEVTNRSWAGNCTLYLCDLKYEDLSINVKGFQGFRYKWW